MNLLKILLFFYAASAHWAVLQPMQLEPLALPTTDMPASDIAALPAALPEQPALAAVPAPSQVIDMKPQGTAPISIMTTPMALPTPIATPTPASTEPIPTPTPLQGPDVLRINEAQESLIKPAGLVASKNFDAVDKAIAEMDQSFDEMRKKLAEHSQTLSNKSLEIDSFLQKTGQIVGELTQRLTNQTTPLTQMETLSIPTLPQPVPIMPLPVTSVTPIR